MNARSEFVCLLVAVVIVMVASGCDRNNCTGSDSTGPIGRLVHSTGCKSWELEAATGSVTSDQDCIKWQMADRSRLRFTHVNAGFNCCPEFDAATYVSGDTIFVVEHEIVGLCDCNCLFDLDYEIRDLEPGIYRVIVTEEYLSEEDEPLDFIMDLLTTPSGSHCVGRDHYPWGL